MRILCCPLIVFYCSSLCYSQGTVTAKRALDLYKDYLAAVQYISFDSIFKDRIAEKSEVFTNVISQRWKIDFVDRRIWRTTGMVGEDADTHSGALELEYAETLVASDTRYELSVDANTKVAKRFTSYLRTLEDYWSKHVGFGYLAYPFGYIKDGQEYKYIPDMIQNASITLTGENSSVVVLKCKSEEYDLNLWLAPSKGWMAERIEYVRRTSTGDPGRPDYCLYAVERSSNYGGVWIPAFYNCKESRPAGEHKLPPNIRIANGVVTVVSEDSEESEHSIKKLGISLLAEVELSNVNMDLLSDSDFQVRATIPDGLAVSMQDAMHLDFVWLDGKIVPRAEAMPILLSKPRFFGGPGSPRFWSLVLTALLVLVLLYLYIRKRSAGGVT